MKELKKNYTLQMEDKVKSESEKELLQESFQQDCEENVNKSVENEYKASRLKNLYQSWNRLDSFLEKSFKKTNKDDYETVNDYEKNIDLVRKIKQVTGMPTQNDVITHFESNVQKYAMKCDVTQQELDNQEIPSRFFQYLYHITPKIGKRVFRNILILIFSFKEIDIKDKTLVLSALGYLISPIDMIPDPLIGIGFVDDIAVISYIFNKVIKGADDQTVRRVDDLIAFLEKEDEINVEDKKTKNNSAEKDSFKEEIKESQDVKSLKFFK